MMRRLLLLGMLLSFSTAAFAQCDFRAGYVVLPAGDTLRGEIECRTAQFRAQRVRLRTGNTTRLGSRSSNKIGGNQALG